MGTLEWWAATAESGDAALKRWNIRMIITSKTRIIVIEVIPVKIRRVVKMIAFSIDPPPLRLDFGGIVFCSNLASLVWSAAAAAAVHCCCIPWFTQYIRIDGLQVGTSSESRKLAKKRIDLFIFRILIILYIIWSILSELLFCENFKSYTRTKPWLG